jgi:hypothetical protein
MCKIYISSSCVLDNVIKKEYDYFVFFINTKHDLYTIDFDLLDNIDKNNIYFCIKNGFILKLQDLNLLRICLSYNVLVLSEFSFQSAFLKYKNNNFTLSNNNKFKLIQFNNSITLNENYITYVINDIVKYNTENISVTISNELSLNLNINIKPLLTFVDNITIHYKESNEESNEDTTNYFLKNKELKFIHITKTAGTIIEDIANEYGLLWGRFDPEIKADNLLDLYKSEFNSDLYHLNPTYFNPVIYNISDTSKLKTFCVVRNPYERIISEVFCNWIGIYNICKDVNKITYELFNKFIEYNITQQNKKFHYAPQWEYVYKKKYADLPENNDKQILEQYTEHILKFEQLEDDFNSLMTDYNINIKLPPRKINSSTKKYNIKDLSTKTIGLISDHYNLDFEMFNYPKIKLSKIDKEELTLVMGYWVVENNKKKDIKSYLLHLQDIIPKLNGYNIIFYYNTIDIKDLIESIITQHNLLINITFKHKELCDLYTYKNNYADISLNAIKNMNIKQLKIDYSSRFEKGIAHYEREFLDGGSENYKNLFTIWTSKMDLVDEVIKDPEFQKKGPTKYIGWCDISITRCNDKYRKNCDFTNMSLNTDKVNFMSNTMEYKGKQLPVSAGIFIGSIDNMSNLIDHYKTVLENVVTDHYCHDEETILGILHHKTDLIQIIE